MLNVPLPFVVFLFLVVLLVRLANQRDKRLFPVIAFIGACAALTLVVGLRWGFDWHLAKSIQPLLASVLPPLAWVLFSDLADGRRTSRVSLHIVPVALVLFFLVLPDLWLSAIDLILALTFLGYGSALIHVAAKGPDGFAAVRLTDAVSANRAASISGVLLLFSGVVDILVAKDLVLSRGAYAETIIVAANLMTLPLLAYAVSFVGLALPFDDTAAEGSRDDANIDQRPDDPSTTAIDEDIVTAIDKLIREKQLFRDPELTLNRLARKALIPTRQISGAVNRVRGKNMSQLLNGYRIEEAKRLLLETDLPITTIMFEAGFQTKSNFNHAFRRVTDQSPSDFRRSNAKVE